MSFFHRQILLLCFFGWQVFFILTQKEDFFSSVNLHRLSRGFLDTKKNSGEISLRCLCVGIDIFFRAASGQVSSAPASLTAVFGMGTGGTSPSLTPTAPSENTYVPSKPNNTTHPINSYEKTPSPLNLAFLNISFLRASSRLSPRPISTGQLNASRHLHLRPISK